MRETKVQSIRSLRALCFALILALPLTGLTQPATAKSEPGLAVTFKSLSGTASDLATAPNVSLFTEAGKSPTPALPAGPFSATWEGTLSVELRGDFVFQAELNGTLKLEINEATVLEANGTGAALPLSKPAQLGKGPNKFRAAFTSPPQGDAFVRLAWAEKGANPSPLALSVLNHTSTAELQKAAELRLGRELFLEYRCAHCHKASFGGAVVPELKMDAPSFEGIGMRRNYDWMARWILDPKALRPSSHMPKVLRGPTARQDAEAIAAYLASATRSPVQAPAAGEPASDSVPKNLFEKLLCSACHDAPGSQEADPKKLPLTQVAEKFAPGSLAEYLRQPEANFVWTRMPNFKLSATEAQALAGTLIAAAAKPKTTTAPTVPAALERGQKLVQQSGCLNCHSLKMENGFSAPKLADLLSPNWTRGCLAAEPAPESKAPRFDFSPAERAALQAFGSTDRLSLTRDVPAEFAERQTRLLNCSGCHGQVEMVPPTEILGGKLKPEWTTQFLAGAITHKPRAEKHPRGEPWMEARMPAFKSRASLLAEGLAAQHGVPPQTPPEPPVDLVLAKIGRKLVGKEGGFSCVSCHGVGPSEATEVVESEGINLAYAAERLLPSYYRRWLRSPISIDPQTKMPLYFEEGKSPLTDTLDGDADKQIDALWQYLRSEGKASVSSSGAK